MKCPIKLSAVLSVIHIIASRHRPHACWETALQRASLSAPARGMEGGTGREAPTSQCKQTTSKSAWTRYKQARRNRCCLIISEGWGYSRSKTVTVAAQTCGSASLYSCVVSIGIQSWDRKEQREIGRTREEPRNMDTMLSLAPPWLLWQFVK